VNTHAQRRDGPRLEEIFRALADSTRLRIVSLLRDGALCVGDLVSVLDLAQPMVSRHLAYLRKAGLVVDERRGQWSFYSLSPETAPLHGHVVACIEAASVLAEATRRDARSLRRLERKGGCCPQHAPKRARP
jgi:ArsR family transcriptional regulator, arsenate/arsenite/antimonite-responsive transcriptional repressor